MKNAVLPVVIGIVVACEVARAYLASVSPPDARDAWAHLREEHHCRLVYPATEPGASSSSDRRQFWLCDGNETVIRDAD